MIQRIGGSLKLALALLGSRFLKPGGIRFGLECQRLLRVIERFRGISGAVVVGAQVHMGRDKFSLTLLVERDCLLVALNRIRIVAQRFLRKPQGIDCFYVTGIETDGIFKLLTSGEPIVLQRKKLTEIVVALAGVWRITNCLLILCLCGIEASNDHQVPTKDFVGISIFHVQAEALRQ